MRNAVLLILGLSGILFISSSVYAQSPLVKTLKTGSDTIEVGSLDSLDWGPHDMNFKLLDLNTRVQLRVDHHESHLDSAMDLKVWLKITSIKDTDYDNFPSGSTDTTIMLKTLQVSYRPDGVLEAMDSLSTFKDVDIQLVGEAYKVYVEVTSIGRLTSKTGTWDYGQGMPKSFVIEAIIEEESIEELDVSEVPSINDVVTYECSEEPVEYGLSWGDVPGAIEYQLEWVYLDDYDPEGDPLATTQVNFDFKLNSTRVVIPETDGLPSYNLPNVFDRGYVVYRVRAVGQSLSYPHLPVYTGWTAPDHGTVADLENDPDMEDLIIETPGHDLDKNWQMQSTYAEGGKRKDVVTYADGTTRGRQVVTRQNSNDLVVVGETIYDKAGRPAIQVLPVPVVKEVCDEQDGHAPIRYYENFNTKVPVDPDDEDELPVQFSWKDFDADVQGADCDPENVPMANGAAFYYSGDYVTKYNSEPNTIILPPHPYIPESHGFPYSQVEYTPDKTGRKRSEGGVGETHQIGSGHETQYFYGKPDQLKLDRLFGSEAGYAAHYQKHMVVDPNGQVSVSYMDRWGRVVATALAGGPPQDADENLLLDPLKTTGQNPVPVHDAASTEFVSNLFEPDSDGNSLLNTADPNADAIVFESQLMVSSAGVQELDYEMIFPVLDIPCLTESCAHCVYDLNLSIKDDCGMEYWDGGQDVTIGKIDGSVTFDNCDQEDFLASLSFNQSEGVYLTEGVYTVTKTVTINEGARQFYLDNFLDNLDANCILDSAQLVLDYQADVDTTVCEITCAACAQNLGTEEEFIAAGLGDAIYYAQLLEECWAPCQAPSWCDVAYGQMLIDVSPGGQYGDYETDDQGIVQQSHDRSSVFKSPYNVYNNIHNASNYSTSNWRTPLLEDDGVMLEGYFQEDGTRTLIPIEPINSTEYEPSIFAGSPIIYDDEGDQYTYPEFLTELDEFMDAWEPGWERSLLWLHPEYFYYQECRKYSKPYIEGSSHTSDRFDGRMMATNTFQDAVDAGFIIQDIIDPTLFYLSDWFTDLGPNHPFDPFVTEDELGPLFYDINNVNPDPDRWIDFMDLFGTVRTMTDVAAFINRCASDIMISPNGDCFDIFAHDPDLSPTENAELKNREWTTLKSFYLAAKYKVQKDAIDAKTLEEDPNADPKCVNIGLNECIGISHFNYWEAGMRWPVNNGNFWNRWQLIRQQPWYWNCQPCGRHNKHYFRNKEQRVLEPDDLPGMDRPFSYYLTQYYLGTGQCPLAIGFQQLLSSLIAVEDNGVTGTKWITEDLPLVENNGYATLFLMQSNHAPQGPMPQDTWVPSIDLNGTELTGQIYAENGIDVLCKIKLDISNSDILDWNSVQILEFSNLQATGFNSGVYGFTIDVIYDQGNGEEEETISGSTCYNILECTFEPYCTPNQLALDMEFLMGSLALADGLVTDLLIDDSNNPDGADMISPTLRAMFPPNADLYWEHSSISLPLPATRFTLSDGQGGTPKLFIEMFESDETGFDVFAVSSWEYVRVITQINGAYENFLEFLVFDEYGNRLAKVKGQAWWDDGTDVEPLSFGDCELAVPMECEDRIFNTMDPLFELVRERILDYNENSGTYTDGTWAAIDLFQSPLMVPSLLVELGPISCPSCDPWGSTPTSYTSQAWVQDVSGGKLLSFKNPGDEGDGVFCPEVEVPDPYGQYLDDITDITDPELVGDPDEDGIYHTIRATAHVDQPPLSFDIFVHTDCIDMRPCDPCPPPTESASKALLGMDDSTLVALGYKIKDDLPLAYPKYKEAVDSLNSRMEWQQNDSNWVDAYTYLEAQKSGLSSGIVSYTKFIENYDPKVDKEEFLRDPSKFLIEYGYATNVKEEYERYLTSVNKYNEKALETSLDTMAPLEVDPFQDYLVADSLFRYVAYLDSMTSNGFEAVGVLEYMAGEQLLPPTDDLCAYAYVNFYLPAYEAFELEMLSDSTPRCKSYNRFSPLYSLNDIYDNNLCCSDTGLNLFYDYILSFYDTLKCPGPLPILRSCPEGSSSMKLLIPEQDCRKHYTYWRSLIKDLNTAVGYVVLDPDEYATYQDFEDAGLCDCVVDYLIYLENLVNLWERYDPNNAAQGPPDLPVSITDYEGCQQVLEPVPDPCVEAFYDYRDLVNYYNSLAINLGFPTIRMWRLEAFMEAGLCQCFPAYEGMILSVLADNTISVEELHQYPELYAIERICEEPEPCPPIELEPLNGYEIVENTCVDDLLNNAELNAQLYYQIWLDEMASQFYSSYTEQCLNNAQETLNHTYTDSEYHYTLYYYDQAGNLIKTIPPEGVEPLNITESGVGDAILVNNDRTYGTKTIYTDHRMASHYTYNSLGQLVSQDMPDHDKMDLWETHPVTGLPTSMRILDSQFPTSSRGYISGYVDGPNNTERGVAYKSDDGGGTWQRLKGLIGADLHDVKMISGTDGYAVGDLGTILKTADGGNTWDLLGSFGSGLGDLRTLSFEDADNGFFAGLANQIGTYDGQNITVGAAPSGPQVDFTGAAHLGIGEHLLSATTTDGTRGVLWGNTDNGDTWATAKELFSLGNDLTAVHAIDEDHAVAVGHDGVQLGTSDGGATWSVVNSHLGGEFLDVAFSEDQVSGVAVIEDDNGDGRLHYTTDGGISWTVIEPGLVVDQLEPYFYDASGSVRISTIAWGADNIHRVWVTDDGLYGVAPVQVPNIVDYTAVNARLNGSALEVFAQGTLPGGQPMHQMVTFTFNALSTSPYPSWVGPYELGESLKQVQFTTFGSGNDVNMVAVGLNAGGDAFSFGYMDDPTPNAPNFWVDVFNLNSKFVDLAADHSKDLVFGYSNTNTDKGFYVIPLLDNDILTDEVLIYNTGLDRVTALGHREGVTQLYAVGDEGLVLQENVDAATLQQHLSFVDASGVIQPLPLNDVAHDGTDYMAVGHRGTVITQDVILMDGEVLKDLTGVTNTGSTFLACGLQGTLLEVDPDQNMRGYTPTDLQSPLSIDLFDITANGNSVQACGTSGHVMYSVDGLPGSFQVSTYPADDMLALAHKPNSSEFIVVGRDAQVHRSTGPNRLLVNDLFTPTIRGINFHDAANGYLVADGYTVRRTLDGGSTWSTVVPDFGVNGVGLNAVHTYESNKAIAVGNDGHISYLLNDDATEGGCPGTDCDSDIFTDIRVSALGEGVITARNGTDGAYVHSPDLLSWTRHTINDRPLNAVWSFDNGNFYIVGAKATVRQVLPLTGVLGPDNFTTNLPEPPDDPEFTDVFFHDRIIGYVAADDGNVYRTTRENGIDQLNLEWKGDPMPASLTIDGQAINADMAPLTISFATRTQGFVGGHYTGSAMERYARLITDGSELISSRFWYDRLGRLVLSQNTEQFEPVPEVDDPDRYSYTLYDPLGRIKEAGEVEDDDAQASLPFSSVFGAEVNGLMDPMAIDEDKLNDFIADPLNERRDVSRTQYDVPGYKHPLSTLYQQDPTDPELGLLRLRVASSYHWDVYDEDQESDDEESYDHATHYQYDIHGNVKTLVQDMPRLADHTMQGAHRKKRLEYEYELLSGNVLGVSYQRGSPDQFHHRYRYDADNRIEHVETSKDGLTWANDASYFYYAHGPLARTELGHDKVQGLDYAYTLQGWLKGVNSNLLAPSVDIGLDGHLSGNPNELVARDAYGFSLDYFEDDFEAIDPDVWNTATDRAFAEMDWANNTHLRPLYNGNIAHMTSTLPELDGPPTSYNSGALGTTYNYDQLNRITGMWANDDLDATNDWGQATGAAANLYHTNYTYDAMGNLLKLERFDHDDTPKKFDELTYHYKRNLDDELLQNRLYQYEDAGTDTDVALAIDGVEDLPNLSSTFDPTDTDINGNYNYGYDRIGNLVRDEKEDIGQITWTASGKVDNIVRPSGSGENRLDFGYDATGQRARKSALDDGGSLESTQYYVRDAQGNIMAIYKLDVTESPAELHLLERPLYGSSRLGVDTEKIKLNLGLDPDPGPDPLLYGLSAGTKQYELADHLGNVHVTISDQHLPVDDDTDDEVDWYEAQVTTAQDYYPFGMLMPGRIYDRAAVETEFIIPDLLWDFEDGRLEEVYGSGLDGTISGTLDKEADQCGVDESAYKMDAGLDRITVADDNALDFGSDNFTISVWVKKLSHQNWGNAVVGKWHNGAYPGTNEWYLGINDGAGGTGNPVFAIESGNTMYAVSSSTNSSLNTWHHLVGMRDGTDIKIYLDGNLEGTLDVGPAAINNVGSDMLIAAFASLYINCHMIVDNLAIYQQALSNQEVEAIYEAGCSTEAEYAASYRFAFNGQEQDDELKGKSNSINFKYRVHDPRLGRFGSIDPLAKSFGWNSPYSFAENKVGLGREVEGTELIVGWSYKVLEWAIGEEALKNSYSGQVATGLYKNYTMLGMSENAYSSAEAAITNEVNEWRNDPIDKIAQSAYMPYGLTKSAENTYAAVEQVIQESLKGNGEAHVDLAMMIASAYYGLKSMTPKSTAYRVQGDKSTRFIIEGGALKIQGDKMLFVTFDDATRAMEFLAQRGDDAYLVKFKLNKSFVDKVRSQAVPQSQGKKFPNSPQKVDATKTDNSFGIRSDQFDELLQNVEAGSVEIIQQ